LKNEKNIKCPYCGSEEVSKPRPSLRVFAVLSLLFFLPLPYFNRGFCHCFDCGKDFKYKRRSK